MSRCPTESTPLLESGNAETPHEALSGPSAGVDCQTVTSSADADSGKLQKTLTTAILGGFATLTYIGLSASMILFNKFLMRDNVFPYPTTLTTMHMISALILALSGQRLFPELFPAYSKVFGKRCAEPDCEATIESQARHFSPTLAALLPFAPIAACGMCSLIAGNGAYRFASVSFLQMVKESHIMFVYILMLLAGLDRFKFRMAAVIMFTASSAMVAVYGEMHFSWKGLCLQLVSGLAGSSQIVLNNLMMAKSRVGKIDPLTLVLCTAPVMLIALVPMNIFFWDSRIPGLIHHWAPYLACNAILAFCLQVSAATLIWLTSGTGFALACVAKDLAIVAAAQSILSESFTMIQVMGFAGSISGIAVYSAMKLFPEAFEPASEQ